MAKLAAAAATQFPSLLECETARMRFFGKIGKFLYERNPVNKPVYHENRVPIYCIGPSLMMRSWLYRQQKPLTALEIHSLGFPMIPAYYVTHYFIPFLKLFDYIKQLDQPQKWLDDRGRLLKGAPQIPPKFSVNIDRAIGIFHRAQLEKLADGSVAPPTEADGFTDLQQPSLQQVLIPDIDNDGSKVWDAPENNPSFLPATLDSSKVLLPNHPRDYVFLDPRTNRWSYIPFSRVGVTRCLQRRKLKRVNDLMRNIARYLNRKERRCDEHFDKLQSLSSAERNMYKTFVAKTNELLERRKERLARMKTVLRERLPGIPKKRVILKVPNVKLL